MGQVRCARIRKVGSSSPQGLAGTIPRGAVHTPGQVWQPVCRYPADYPRGSDPRLLFPSLKEFITSGTKF